MSLMSYQLLYSAILIKEKISNEYSADAEELLRSYFDELTLQGYSEISIFLYLQNTQTGVIGLEPMNVRIKI